EILTTYFSSLPRSQDGNLCHQLCLSEVPIEHWKLVMPKSRDLGCPIIPMDTSTYFPEDNFQKEE
ncbi:hypothetical protein LEMLEM_LOCUS7506, partial [Lemmus lemmus]